MKKLLKILLYLIGGIVVIAGGFALFILIRGIPSYEPEKVDLKVEVTSERVEHGRKIASVLCAGCHLDPTTQVLSGKHMDDLPEFFGTIYSRNITRDPVKGIGKWTDGEIAYLLRTGIRRTGEFVPVMGGFRHMSDDDLESVIAFLRSNDPMVAPAAVDSRESDYTFFSKFLCLVAFEPGPYPKTRITAPDSNDKVAFGKYLVTARMECYACHSADFATNNADVPEQSEGYLGGGTMLLDVNRKAVYSRNITLDPETGIGNWNEAQFSRALRDGFRPDNTPLRYPMERYSMLTDHEVSAIYAYLQTVPKRKNKVQASEVLTADAGGAAGGAAAGKEIYYKYACYSCHGTTGIGNCDLRGADRKYRSNDQLIAWIRDPSQFMPGTKMPTWHGVIREEEYAPLAEYVRELGRAPAAAPASASR